MNNLLERLHASFFFYLLVGTTTFMKIGTFLPSAVLVSTAMLFGGLGEWVDARWVETLNVSDEMEEKDGESPKPTKWVTRRRPVIPALSIVVATHALGTLLFYLLTCPWIVEYQQVRSTDEPMSRADSDSSDRCPASVRLGSGSRFHALDSATNAVARRGASFQGPEVVQPLPGLHGDLHHLCVELLACSRARHPHGRPTINIRLVAIAQNTTHKVWVVYRACLRLVSVRRQRRPRSIVELGGAGRMVRSICLYRVHSTSSTSGGCMFALINTCSALGYVYHPSIGMITLSEL